MRLLHTSDWHLGATLCGRKRYDEGEAFLNWLTSIIIRERIETLIIAGDIFDSGNPSNLALKLYYQFLNKIAQSGCLHIVITAGNHDSPSLLAAPKELLSALDIHVIGAITEDPSDEVLILHDKSGDPALILCAVPFLRDRDIRIAEAGESIDEKKFRLLNGISDHYQKVCKVAELHQTDLGRDTPIVATGHLFAAGGSILKDDGVRELSVGNLVQVGSDTFPPCIDYLALGHLHQPQLVGGMLSRRYSGAPLAMGFGESGKEKEVIIVDITPERQVRTNPLQVPPIRRFVQVTGDLEKVLSQLGDLKFIGRPVWVEVQLDDPRVLPGAREEIYALVEKTRVDVLRVKNIGLVTASISQITDQESLQDLNPMEVFRRCLSSGEEPEENWDDLTAAYQEILSVVLEDDTNAE
ncbi:MAG: exonuclease SbcCD subunit D C-terminal domain-containing protein [Methanobacteriota archaeon]